MYCVKCRKKTNTSDSYETTSKNNKKMLKGKCVVCRKNKCQFIGSGVIADKIIATMPEMHLPFHSYTGPFTKLDKKLDFNDNPLPGYEPYNQIDAISLKHDICYRDNPKFKDKNKICDKKMLEDLKKVKPTGIREWMDKKLVQGVIGAKKFSGLGNK